MILTQADLDLLMASLIVDAKIELEQTDGNYGPVRTVKMLKLASDYFKGMTVEGDLVIPPVNFACNKECVASWFPHPFEMLGNTASRRRRGGFRFFYHLYN